MMKASLLFHVVFLVLCLGLFSCGPQLVYEQAHDFQGQWAYADSVAFQYEIQDVDQAYDLVLNVSHTDVYPTQNVYTRFVTQYPNGMRDSEEVSLELADKFGQWLGDCRGENCVLRIPLQQGAKYPEAGKYGLTIHQFGRQDSLQAIEGLQLSIFVASD